MTPRAEIEALHQRCQDRLRPFVGAKMTPDTVRAMEIELQAEVREFVATVEAVDLVVGVWTTSDHRVNILLWERKLLWETALFAAGFSYAR